MLRKERVLCQVVEYAPQGTTATRESRGEAAQPLSVRSAWKKSALRLHVRCGVVFARAAVPPLLRILFRTHESTYLCWPISPALIASPCCRWTPSTLGARCAAPRAARCSLLPRWSLKLRKYRPPRWPSSHSRDRLLSPRAVRGRRLHLRDHQLRAAAWWHGRRAMQPSHKHHEDGPLLLPHRAKGPRRILPGRRPKPN